MEDCVKVFSFSLPIKNFVTCHLPPLSHLNKALFLYQCINRLYECLNDKDWHASLKDKKVIWFTLWKQREMNVFLVHTLIIALLHFVLLSQM
jgi:hypothetical protein